MTAQAMSTRQFIEVATDTYVRGPEHRAYLNRRADVTAPIDAYLDQLWGPSLTPQQAELYKAVQKQLIDNILSGAIKTYSWPMLVLDTHPTLQAVEMGSSVILLADFRKWVKKNSPAARADWLDLIMEATEPEGEPIQRSDPDSPKVQMRGKATRTAKIPTQDQISEYAEVMPFSENIGKCGACNAFAEWLVAKGHFGALTGRALENWLDWDNRALRLKHNGKALDRIENNRK